MAPRRAGTGRAEAPGAYGTATMRQTAPTRSGCSRSRPWRRSHAPEARRRAAARRRAPPLPRRRAPSPTARRGRRVEERLRPAVVGLAEAVDAVDRDRHRRHRHRAAQHGGDVLDRGEPAALDRDDLRHVVGQPEAGERVAVEGQDDDRAAADAAQLAQPGVQIRPLVDRDRGHRRVEAVVVEREPLGRRVDRGGQVPRALCAHRGRGLDRGDVAVRGLVRAGARADVDDAPRVAERGVHVRGDARIGAPQQGVALPSAS